MDVTWFAETNVTTSHAPLHHFLQRLATDLPAMGVKPFECVMVSSIDTQNNIFSILLGGVCTLVYTGISGFYIFVRLWYQNSTFPLEFTARHFNRLEPSKSSKVGILLGVNQDIQILQIHVIFCSHPYYCFEDLVVGAAINPIMIGHESNPFVWNFTVCCWNLIFPWWGNRLLEPSHMIFMTGIFTRTCPSKNVIPSEHFRHQFYDSELDLARCFPRF